METQDIMKIGIGTKDTQKLKPTKVKILGVEIQNKKADGTAMKTPLIQILVKHPDREEPVKLSKIKAERNGKLEVITIWVALDEEGKFKKSSAIAELLKFLKVESLEQLAGKDVETIEQSKEDAYLCIKAY
jgi:hypothetical protein